jgi:DNA-binding NarL/FixJ family response regulator
MDDVSVLLVAPGGRTSAAFIPLEEPAFRLTVRGPEATAAAALRVLRHVRIDVILVDVDDGVDPLAMIRSGAPDACILAWTSQEDPVVAAGALSAGASGVLSKTADGAVASRAIRCAIAGELVLPDGHLWSLFEEAGRGRDGAAHPAGLASLTGREREVLALVAEGWSTRDVATRLGITPGTVQSHVKSILAKLGVHSKVEAARIAWRDGGVAVPA